MPGSEEVRAARRDLGRRLAAYRDAAGLTQHQLAPLVFYGRSTVANAETGRQQTGRTFWERCDAVLNADGALLGAYEAVQSLARERRQAGWGTTVAGYSRQLLTWPTQGPVVSVTMAGSGPDRPPLDEEKVSRWVGADTVELVSDLTRKDLTLDRREVTRTLAAIAFGSPLLEALERWLAGTGDQQRPGRLGSVGYQEVAQIEYAARLFREWDDQFGGGLRRKAVIGQLNEVADLLRDSHPADIRQRLFGVMAQLAETAAMMSWDSGYQGLAQRYYVMAFRAAKTAGDLAFGANVLAGMARQLLYLGRPLDALELVRVAQETSGGHATPAVRAMLHTREAWAYAKLGRVTAFHRATGKAEEALADSRAADEPYWIGYFDRAELEGTTGGRLLELAHRDKRYAAETVERISRAVAHRGVGHLRSSALDQIGLAEARLIEGECEEASVLGEAATAVVEQTLSDRVRVKLVELYQTSDAYASVLAVAGLRERIRFVLATPQPA